MDNKIITMGKSGYTLDIERVGKYSIFYYLFAPVAQWIEQWFPEPCKISV